MKHCSQDRTRMVRPRHMALWLLVLVTSASGASCPQFLNTYTPPAARALPAGPTLSQITAVVNDNSNKVVSLYTDDASISVPRAPTIRASLALDRPLRFRLRGETRLTGPEVDLGSNEELFWFWVRRDPSQAVYHCRHDQFHSSSAAMVLPVEPHWLIEALGLVYFDPALAHQGPFPAGQGRLQILTPLETPRGQMTKVTVIDEARGWVLGQHLYDARNQLVASALAGQHQRDPLSEVTLPSRVEIHWPATQFSMRIELKNVAINQLPRNQDLLWSLPDYQGYTPVDLARWR
ncbi:MAG: hypothetical protein WD847_09605 [Pirellulales bacterium]